MKRRINILPCNGHCNHHTHNHRIHHTYIHYKEYKNLFILAFAAINTAMKKWCYKKEKKLTRRSIHRRNHGILYLVHHILVLYQLRHHDARPGLVHKIFTLGFMTACACLSYYFCTHAFCIIEATCIIDSKANLNIHVVLSAAIEVVYPPGFSSYPGYENNIIRKQERIFVHIFKV